MTFVYIIVRGLNQIIVHIVPQAPFFMTISYQFLEGAKMGSPCGGHIGQIQDGRHPELDILITSEPRVF